MIYISDQNIYINPLHIESVKIVDTMDMIANDIRMTAEDNYLGKYANSYDNKCLLLSAIGNYFDQLVAQNVISNYRIEIDIDANRSYLKGKGKDVEAMSDDDIKVANTGSSVFLKATLSILDAIEDIFENEIIKDYEVVLDLDCQ